MKHISIFIAILLVVLSVEAQETTPEAITTPSEIPEQLSDVVSAEFRTGSLTPLVGEPIEISLIVEVPENIVVVGWPEFESQWGDFMVLEAPEHTADIQSNGNTVYTQVLDLRLWQTGDTRTPETFIRYQTLEDNETYSVPVRPLFFTVPSVLETTDLNQLNLKPWSPLINMFYIPMWAVLVGIVAVIGLGYGGWTMWQRWRANPNINEIEVLSPLEKILNVLDMLSQNVIDTPAAEIYAAVVTELRTYLSLTYDEITLDMTHEDIIATLKQAAHETEKQIDDLRRILDQGTLVKYAAAVPSEQNSERFIDFTRQWLLEAQEQVISE